MADYPTRPELKLIPTDRSTLEDEIRRLLWTGTNEELHAAVERFARRGTLRVVEPDEEIRVQTNTLRANAGCRDA